MKKPFVTLDQLKRIAEKYPTPYHLYDEKGIRENARRLKAAFSWNPGFREYFAVKATPTPKILKILHEEGCGTDCSSLTELLLSQRIGITGSDIMFSSNATPPEEYLKALELGAIINLDDYTHVDFLSKLGPIPEQSVAVTTGRRFCHFQSYHGQSERRQIRHGRENRYRGFKKLKTLARGDLASTRFWPAIRCPTIITRSLQRSCSSWRSISGAKRGRILSSSTCRAVSESLTGRKTKPTTSWSSARAYAKPTNRSSCRREWEMYPFTRNSAGSCWGHTAAL
jgi:hypothetical protein